MGATNFVEEFDAANAREGFNRLSDMATEEYGIDMYNGTISTCNFGRVTHTVAKNYSETARKKAIDVIHEEDYGVKWTANAVDCGIVAYRITKWKKIPHTKADAQYRTVYSIRRAKQNGQTEYIQDFETQAEANTALKTIVATTRYLDDSYRIEVVKRSKMVKGASDVATRYDATIRTTKAKPTKVPAGTIVEEIHHWMYYGWAAC